MRKLAAVSFYIIGTVMVSNVVAATNNTEEALKKINERTKHLEAELAQLRAQVDTLKNEKKSKAEEGTFEEEIEKYAVGFPVVTSPYLGLRSRFEQSDLLINLPSINHDLRLLEQRQKLDNFYLEQGKTPPQFPFLELSGELEVRAASTGSFRRNTTSDIDLSEVKLDVASFLNSWVTGNISINYENSPDGRSPSRRTPNSRLFVNRAFITVGNLNKTPFYATAGQIFVPFGRYASHQVTSPLTTALFRTKARVLLLGYKQPTPNGIYSSVYTFKGDNTLEGKAENINSWGLNVGYDFKIRDVSGDVGIGYINSVAESNGMQGTGLRDGQFGGFGTPNNAKLKYNVGGYAIRGQANYKKFAIMSEYITAARRFHTSDLVFNDRGAQPKALNIEGSYTFMVKNKRTRLALGYGQTMEALALNLPKHRYSVTLASVLIPNTLASIEYRHEKDYGAGDSASGRGGPRSINGTGKSRNVITAKFNIFW